MLQYSALKISCGLANANELRSGGTNRAKQDDICGIDETLILGESFLILKLQTNQKGIIYRSFFFLPNGTADVPCAFVSINQSSYSPSPSRFAFHVLHPDTTQ